MEVVQDDDERFLALVKEGNQCVNRLFQFPGPTGSKGTNPLRQRSHSDVHGLEDSLPHPCHIVVSAIEIDPRHDRVTLIRCPISYEHRFSVPARCCDQNETDFQGPVEGGEQPGSSDQGGRCRIHVLMQSLWWFRQLVDATIARHRLRAGSRRASTISVLLRLSQPRTAFGVPQPVGCDQS
jgi:hypothetical protein